ncbi:MAG: 5-formyltetrahydrofolate cyclo-ligase [Chlamydiales bacterium]|nr:5-formyltetrahydrofolate cyclo-ligase [Chlamydiales bacterium]
MKMDYRSKSAQKEEFRVNSLKTRAAIKQHRREEARKNISSFAKEIAASASFILSFSSIGSEIQMYDVNKFLAAEGKLILPKISKNKLLFYKVGSIGQLSLNSLSILEPLSVANKQVDISDIELALVPGLSFDTEKNRLGYGKGFYDRSFIDFRGLAIGVGFKEQLSQKILPVEPHDTRLDHLKLF